MGKKRRELEQSVLLLEICGCLCLPDKLYRCRNVRGKDIGPETPDPRWFVPPGSRRKVGKNGDCSIGAKTPSCELHESLDQLEMGLALTQRSVLIARDLKQLLERCKCVPQGKSKVRTRIVPNLVGLWEGQPQE